MDATNRVKDFISRHHNIVARVAPEYKPNWIYVNIRSLESDFTLGFRFDFKNDAARKDFGALCHVLYTCSEAWMIQTHRKV